MAAAGEYAAGAVVYVPDERDAYVPAKVVSCKGFGADAVLKVAPLRGGAEYAVPARDLPHVCEADPLSLEGADDMVKFTQLTDAAVLHNLRARYASDTIYSCAGSILVSVNPFKQIPSYGDELMARCKATDAKGLHEMPPHVFVVAEQAFRGMLSEGKQQSILISGESGAGKTEAAKYCLRYIVGRCGVAARETDSGTSSARTSKVAADFVERCILEACATPQTPVLHRPCLPRAPSLPRHCPLLSRPIRS
jgi:myosin-5